LEDLGADGRLILKCILNKYDWMLTELVWLSVGALMNRILNLGYYRILGITWLAKELLASRVRLCCVELFWLVGWLLACLVGGLGGWLFAWLVGWFVRCLIS
jgi:hypothetical protein